MDDVDVALAVVTGSVLSLGRLLLAQTQRDEAPPNAGFVHWESRPAKL